MCIYSELNFHWDYRHQRTYGLYTHAHAHTHTPAFSLSLSLSHSHEHTHTHTRTHTHTHIHTYTHTHTHTHTHSHTHSHWRASAFECKCIWSNAALIPRIISAEHESSFYVTKQNIKNLHLVHRSDCTSWILWRLSSMKTEYHENWAGTTRSMSSGDGSHRTKWAWQC